MNTEIRGSGVFWDASSPRVDAETQLPMAESCRAAGSSKRANQRAKIPFTPTRLETENASSPMHRGSDQEVGPRGGRNACCFDSVFGRLFAFLAACGWSPRCETALGWRWPRCCWPARRLFSCTEQPTAKPPPFPCGPALPACRHCRQPGQTSLANKRALCPSQRPSAAPNKIPRVPLRFEWRGQPGTWPSGLAPGRSSGLVYHGNTS